MARQESGVEFRQPLEDDLGVAGQANFDGVMAHKILFIVRQKDFVLIDDPGIARLAGAHVGRDLLADEERIDQKFQHPGEHPVRPPVERGEEAHHPAPLPGRVGINKGLTQKEVAAVGRVPGPLEKGGG